ncbi:hypothetical protein EXIGLDRAFT_735238 [Exidia glandulosa HHB12029]|uniref:Uncharacterized protein n=1 Tax=Exidia glandulosa HHB12029 TaxID=1314781 RepID=A0A165ASK1_EXIGL|nr:hypothetical protein EXIGLDRAFT_735238 [Exidia glandulosa HHB12029]
MHQGVHKSIPETSPAPSARSPRQDPVQDLRRYAVSVQFSKASKSRSSSSRNFRG